MKQFSLKCFLFVLPAIVIIVLLEAFVTLYPSTFNIKSSSFKKNLHQVEILVLGSSHNQNAINPDYFGDQLYNIAYGGQDIQLDSLLFFKYVPKMTALKTVVLEFDYLTINNRVDKDYFRLPWYYRYYGISPYNLKLKNKLSLYGSSPSFFNNFIKNTFFTRSFSYKINEKGFITNDFIGVFDDANYSIDVLGKAYKNEIKKVKEKQNIENVTFNLNKIDEIVSYCLDYNIRVVLTTPPIYLKQNDFTNPIIQQMMRRYIDSVISNKHIHYLDCQNDERFTIEDFKNFDHLNSNGAKKYSLILNAYFNQLQ